MKRRIFFILIVVGMFSTLSCYAQDALYSPPVLLGFNARYIGAIRDTNTHNGFPTEQLIRQLKYMRILAPKVENGIVSLSCKRKEALCQGMEVAYYRYARRYAGMVNRLSRNFQKYDWQVIDDQDSVVDVAYWLGYFVKEGKNGDAYIGISPREALAVLGVSDSVYNEQKTGLYWNNKWRREAVEQGIPIAGGVNTPSALQIYVYPHPNNPDGAFNGLSKRQKKNTKRLQRVYDSFFRRFDRLNADIDARNFEWKKFDNTKLDFNFAGSMKLEFPKP